MLTIIEIKAREDGGHGLQSQSHRTECWLEGWIAVPPELEELIVSPGRFAAELRDTLGIGSDWAVRWHTLSFGERKRSQIGCALIGGYDILLLDEPTNHLDAASSEQLRNALRCWTNSANSACSSSRVPSSCVPADIRKGSAGAKSNAKLCAPRFRPKKPNSTA